MALGACLLYAVSTGLRNNYGILLDPVIISSGLDYASVSFVIAVGQLVFGIMQPVFGIIALKRSNRFVLMIGASLMATGMLLIPYCDSIITLMLAFGIILPAGTGAISFGIIMGTITPALGERKAATVSGLVNASTGIGSSIFAPLLRTLLASVGFARTALILSIPILLLLPISWFISSASSTASGNHINEEKEGIPEMFKNALKNRTYLLLMTGFFVCGFHMAIIQTHLFSQFIRSGISDSFAAYAFSIYGIAMMLGAILSGIVVARIKMRTVLAFLYGSRAVLVLLFLLLPTTPTVALLFAIGLGLTSASTVTPTSGLVSRTFGSAKLGTLFGFVFFSHQVGSFISAWIGGVAVAAAGGYTLIWVLDIFVCVIASVASYAIREPARA